MYPGRSAPAGAPYSDGHPMSVSLAIRSAYTGRWLGRGRQDSQMEERRVEKRSSQPERGRGPQRRPEMGGEED